MDLVNQNYGTGSNNKKILMALIIGIIALILIVIVLLVYATTANKNKIKLVVDNQEYKYSDYLIDKDGVYYIWIEGLAKIIPSNGYNYKSGDIDVEDENTCYVTNSRESTFFKVGSNEIYKILSETGELHYYTLDNPIIKESNGKIYMPINATKIAMNTAFEDANGVFTIVSIGYMESLYNQEESDTFKPDTSIVWDTSYANKKLLKDGYVIVKDSSDKLGVAEISSSTDDKNKKKSITKVSTSSIITPKYTSIEYIERYNQLIVESEKGDKGIIQLSENNGKETIITPQYEDIRPINEKMFLVSKTVDETSASGKTDSSSTTDKTEKKDNTKTEKKDNKKYGIIGLEEEILPMEYDEIGVNISKYTNNDLNNKYIIYDNLIPVKKNNLWGFVNLDGKVVIKLEYDDLGCDTSSSSSNVLLVPELNAIVVEKDDKYGIVTKNNVVLIKNSLNRVYKETIDGKEIYSIVFNNSNKENLIDYINSLDETTNENTNKDTNKTTNETTNKDTNKTTGESTNKDTSKTTGESTNNDTSKTTNETTNKDTSKTTGESTNNDTSKTTNETTNKDTSKTTNQTTNKDTSKTTNETTNKDTSKTTNESTNKTTNGSTNNNTDKTTNSNTNNTN